MTYRKIARAGAFFVSQRHDRWEFEVESLAGDASFSAKEAHGSMKELPRLEPGQTYRISGFEYFEHGRNAMVCLHLKNMTTIDVPASDVELKRLLTGLIEAFGEHAVSYIKQRGLI